MERMTKITYGEIIKGVDLTGGVSVEGGYDSLITSEKTVTDSTYIVIRDLVSNETVTIRHHEGIRKLYEVLKQMLLDPLKYRGLRDTD